MCLCFLYVIHIRFNFEICFVHLNPKLAQLRLNFLLMLDELILEEVFSILEVLPESVHPIIRLGHLQLDGVNALSHKLQ